MANLEWQPIKIKLGQIIPWEANPRQSTKAQAERLIRSEKRLGQMQTLAVSPADKSGMVQLYDGHQRCSAWLTVKGADYEILALQSNRYLSEDERKEAAVILHTATGQWDWNSLSAWGAADLREWGMDETTLQTWGGDYANLNGLLESEKEPTDQPSEQEQARRKLADRFGVPPFSVLDARQGYWQDRKRAWIALGIKGELGRGDEVGALNDSAEFADPLARKAAYDQNGLLGFSKQVRSGYGETFGSGKPSDLPNAYKNQGKSNAMRANAKAGGAPMPAMDYTDGERGEGAQSGTSVFDPVLVELVYRWFCPTGGKILDPFAGESTKGIVSEYLGYPYTGIELRAEQIAANEAQAEIIKLQPKWILGDSEKIGQLLPAGEMYDLIFTSPPYYDLEIYSESEKDGSAFETYEKFMQWYKNIFEQFIARLNENRFLVVKIGEIRHKKTGVYRNFLGDNISCFIDLGLQYYNEMVLVTAIGSLPLRVGRAFSIARKIGKTHQNILVFYKGNPKHIKDYFPLEVDHADLEAINDDQPSADEVKKK